MPIYEYECGMCHYCFEKKQGFDEKPVAICPKCKGKAERIFRPVPIIFKGSGFYVTDHPSGGGTREKAESAKPSEVKKKGSG